MADPGFSRGGANSQGWCSNLLFCKMLAENCMKMKEFRSPGRGHVPGVPPLDLPMLTETAHFSQFRHILTVSLDCHFKISVIVNPGFWFSKEKLQTMETSGKIVSVYVWR